MTEQRLKRYLYLLEEQYFANKLGFGSTWTGGMTELDLLWKGFTDEEQQLAEEQWLLTKSKLDSHVPVALPTPGLVDQVPSNGVPPRKPS